MNILSMLYLGSDSLVGAVVVGPLVPRGRRLGVAALFGGCDAIATAVGSVVPLPVPPATDQVVAMGMAVYGCYLLLLCNWLGRRAGQWVVYVTPILVSFDNLVAGAGGRTATVLLVGSIAVSSSLLAIGGLGLSAAVTRISGVRAERLVGLGLLAVGAIALIS